MRKRNLLVPRSRSTSKQTSTAIGSLAAKVLADPHSCIEAKELAGSVLSQVRHLHGQASAH
jgi:hypothetical protein